MKSLILIIFLFLIACREDSPDRTIIDFNKPTVIGQLDPLTNNQIAFSVPQKAKIELWIVKLEERGSEGPSLSTGTYFYLGGERIRTLINDTLYAGYHSILWDLNDDNGRPVPSGFYRLYLSALSDNEIFTGVRDFELKR